FTEALPLAEPLALAPDEFTEAEPLAEAEPFTETSGFPTAPRARLTAPCARVIAPVALLRAPPTTEPAFGVDTEPLPEPSPCAFSGPRPMLPLPCALPLTLFAVFW